MERRGFLKALGILVTSAAVPDYLPKAVDYVEKKCEPPKVADKGIFVNHMTIQRESHIMTGSATLPVKFVLGKGWQY